MNKEQVINALREMETKSGIAEVICDISVRGIVVYPNESILVKLCEPCDDNRIATREHWCICDNIADFEEGVVYGQAAAEKAYCKHYVSEFKKVEPFETDFW